MPFFKTILADNSERRGINVKGFQELAMGQRGVGMQHIEVFVDLERRR